MSINNSNNGILIKCKPLVYIRAWRAVQEKEHTKNIIQASTVQVKKKQTEESEQVV